ncbi:MAG: hypothetical protein K2I92_06760 [Muribaculaceae bacterium]|nr:hypothetical protein [Muribaculaceae bacterium]
MTSTSASATKSRYGSSAFSIDISSISRCRYECDRRVCWQKDYYDYLTGIYGEDEKVVYDRRKEVIDNRTDEEKAESAGFDRKTSFRHIK